MASAPRPAPSKNGLSYWMERVLKEISRASLDFAPDPVHDLRVALRRCRSMAEVVQSFDPDPTWRRMRKAGKRVFSSLGDLRDCQILIEWVERLSAPDDPVSSAMLANLRAKEQELKAQAGLSLRAFDLAQWQKWSKSLSKRIQHYRPDGELYQGVALARWHDARELHRAAVRSRSKVALHRLRIGVKKFRYVVENFLPIIHGRIGGGLKETQDLLGEVHDLDVLWETLLRSHSLDVPDDRTRWSDVIQKERQKRVERYKELVRNGMWEQWRSCLPSGSAEVRVSRRRFQTWSSLQDPDPPHSRRVAGIAVAIYDYLVREKLAHADGDQAREVLYTAAIAHDVGKSDGNSDHHKTSRKRISKLSPPYGWQHEDILVAAGAVRYHRGALPRREQKLMRALSAEARKTVVLLGAILRLANALDHANQLKPSRIRLERDQGRIVVNSSMFVEGSSEAERVAGARYLLEQVCGLPILVRSMS